MSDDVLLPDLPAGVYRHYKGPLYLVLGYAHDANADEFHSDKSRADGWSADPLFPGGRTVVVYVGLQLDAAHTGARLAVRTAEDFFTVVHLDGTTCTHFGSSVINPEGAPFGERELHCMCSPGRQQRPIMPRFKYLGPSL